MKDPKTTIVASVVGFILIVLVGALIMHRIDVEAFGAAAGTVGASGATVLGYLGADSKKS